jgi:hypothetical protein
MRMVNRLLSLLLGLGLVAAGLVALVELAAFALRVEPVLVPVERWLGALRSTVFGERGVLLVCGGTALAGLLLLLAQVWPRRARRARLSGSEHGVWWLERSGAEQAIRRAVLQGTHATWAHARLRPRARRWRVAVEVGTPPVVGVEALRPEVEHRTRAALARLGAPRTSVLRVFLQRDLGDGR